MRLAARLWARGWLLAPHRFPSDPDESAYDHADETDETDEAAALFGLRIVRPQQPDEPGEPRDDGEPFWLWPQLWPIWCLWRDVETQWQIDAMGERCGLDYAGVWSVIEQRFRPRRRREAFWLVQAMEDAELDERRKMRRD